MKALSGLTHGWTLALCTLALCIVGCSQFHTAQPPQAAVPQPMIAGGADPDYVRARMAELGAAESDSIYGEADRLLDSLGVEVDPLLAGPLPAMSDSLAALARAQLPTCQELFDYPVVINPYVLAWIDYYQVKVRDFFNRSLHRSGRYLAMGRRIFAEEGVPQDLAFLPHVESGFRYNARSKAKAVGLWQFMRGTGKLYGLRCDGAIDERLDPEKATRAAARHLRDLHDIYGDWYLALAAYNAGAGKVSRAIERAGTRDFWELIRTSHLRSETRNFVPAMLAATILAKSPGAYGFNEETHPPLQYDTAVTTAAADLRVMARCAGTSQVDIQELNPALLGSQAPRGYELRLPKGTGDAFAVAFAKLPPEDRIVVQRHRVKSGESLGLLATRYHTTVKAIQEANGLGRSTIIRVNQDLKIPSRGGAATLAADAPTSEPTRHTVRRGECLAGIARRYGLSAAELQQANALADPSRLVVGQELRIPGRGSPAPEPVTEAIASREETAEVAAVVQDEAPDVAPVAEGGLRALNDSHSLGRVPTTRHIVDEAREQYRLEQALSVPVLPDTRSSRSASTGSSRSAGGSGGAHVVKRGETLSTIARHHGVQLQDLLRWNKLSTRSVIRPGQKLALGGSTAAKAAAPLASKERRLHVVRNGESLWKIASRYGIAVTDLASWNGLRRTTTIYPGQKLKIY